MASAGIAYFCSSVVLSFVLCVFALEDRICVLGGMTSSVLLVSELLCAVISE